MTRTQSRGNHQKSDTLENKTTEKLYDNKRSAEPPVIQQAFNEYIID
jgi:hypothetical protein